MFVQIPNKYREFDQMTAREGFKRFGEDAVIAMLKEYTQLDKGAVEGKPVIEGISADSLSEEQKKQALEAVNLIKKKNSGLVKGRACTDGSKQHLYMKPGESYASPTVSLEATLTTLMIDVFEDCDVAICDVPGAFLQAKMPEGKTVIMRIRGRFVDILCEVNPEYKKYVTIENGKKVLYVKVLRAIYGCIESALQWYLLYRDTLEKEGFEINPYDCCVANKIINGKQCTITWFVDDNKVSHCDPNVVTSILDMLKSHFGDHLVIQPGKVFNLLGMCLEIMDDKRIKISMKDHVEEALEMFGEPITGTVSSPHTKKLFDITPAKELDLK